MFAISPKGIGQRVGARRISAEWPLVDGEAFIADDWNDGMVLAADGLSLEQGVPPPTGDDVNSERERRIRLGVTVKTSTGKTIHVQTRTSDEMALIDRLAARAIVMEQAGGGAITFRDADNVNYEMQASEVLEMKLLVDESIEAIYKASWELKSGVIPGDYADDRHWP